MATVVGSCCSRFSTEGELIGSYTWRSRIFTLNRCLYQPLRQTGRSRLVVRCASEEAGETPKPKPRRRKKAEASSESTGEDGKAKKRQPKASLDSDEAPTEKKKKPRRRKKADASSESTEEDGKAKKRQPKASLDSDEAPTEKKKKVTRPRKKKTVEATEPVQDEKTATSRRKKSQSISKEESTYDKEERWKIMEEERLQVIKGTLLDKEEDFVSDEDEEEEEDEDDEEESDDDRDQSEEFDSGNKKFGVKRVFDRKFPDEPCYALVSSYKPRKLDKDEPLPLKNEELWWSQRKPSDDEHIWSRYQRRPGTPEATLAAMSAMIGQIKLFGETPTIAEAHLYRARRFVFYKERLAAEERRRKEIGPMAYYQEWVEAWDKDTSKEAVEKHYKETGEDVALQLMNMLACQTREEYRHMMGTDVRIKRDPLEMRATREMKRSVFGGDPVYPTINYIKKPGEVVDYRGPNFHQPQPSVIEYLIKCGTMKTREEHNRIMAMQEARLAAEAEMYSEEDEEPEEMAAAVDIGDKDIEDDENDEDDEDEDDFKEEEGVVVVPPEKLLQLSDEDPADDDEEGNVIDI